MNRRVATSLFLVSLFSVAAFGQSSATATANITARVLTPIAITKLTDLNFGSLIPGTSAGQVIVDPSGARSAVGVTLVNSAYGAATFAVTGEPLTPYTIILPTGAQINHTTAASQNMQVSFFNSNPSATGGGTLSSVGSQQLNVGATLNVGPASTQLAGLYTGTFNVTVAY